MQTFLGTLGFSWLGLVFLVGLFAPNIAWGRSVPEGYKELSARESRVLLGFERVGQVLTTCCGLVFVRATATTASTVLLALATACMVLYEAAWTRYFARGRTIELMHRPLLGVPLPLATLPVAAFVLLGLGVASPALVVSAVILGIGHIGIHAGHVREMQG